MGADRRELYQITLNERNRYGILLRTAEAEAFTSALADLSIDGAAARLPRDGDGDRPLRVEVRHDRDSE